MTPIYPVSEPASRDPGHTRVPVGVTGWPGKGEDGRAGTREVKLAVFFTQDKLDEDGYPVRDPGSSSYLATFEPASVFAGLVEAEGIRRGAGRRRAWDGQRGGRPSHARCAVSSLVRWRRSSVGSGWPVRRSAPRDRGRS